MSVYYTEYIEARNGILFNKLKDLPKDVIIQMILGRSSDEYLENMYQELCKDGLE